MGQTFAVATSDFEISRRQRMRVSPSRQSMDELSLPEPRPSSPPSDSYSLLARATNVGVIPCVGPCMPMQRRRTTHVVDSTPTIWSDEVEGKRRAEWAKASRRLKSVLRTYGLNESKPGANLRPCRLLVVLELIRVYWDIDQLVRRRSAHVEECKSWIQYTRSSKIPGQRIIREMTRGNDEAVETTNPPSESRPIEQRDAPTAAAAAPPPASDILLSSRSSGSSTRLALNNSTANNTIAADGEEKEGSRERNSARTAMQHSGISVAAIIHSAFPNISEAIVIQELGFIERSRFQSVAPSRSGSSISVGSLPPCPNGVPPAVPTVNAVTHADSMSTDQSGDSGERSFDPAAILPPIVVELFLKNQLPMFLEKEQEAEHAAVKRLLLLHKTGISWIHHMRNIIRKKYVEIVAKQLDIQEAATIKLSAPQLQALFEAKEIDVYNYLLKVQSPFQSNLIPYHLEPGNLQSRVRPRHSPLASITASAKREASLSFDVVPSFPAPPVVPSDSFIDPQEPPAVTFKMIEILFHRCLLDPAFFKNVWAEYKQIDPSVENHHSSSSEWNSGSEEDSDEEDYHQIIRGPFRVAKINPRPQIRVAKLNPRKVSVGKVSTNSGSKEDELTVTI